MRTPTTHSQNLDQLCPPPQPAWCESLTSSEETSLTQLLNVGSVGVRGLVANVAGASHAEKVASIGQALVDLKAAGLRRAHIIQPVGSDLYVAGLEAGFVTCPGETLFLNDLETRPSIRHECPPPYQLRDGELRDLQFIQSRLGEIKELAFQGWEVLLIGLGLDRPNQFFKVIERDGDIVGVSIGGSHGGRGTISHTWVAEGHRNHGLGQTLSDASLQALYDGGARLIHLMTVANNTKAEQFWERQGFVRQETHTFLEIDI